MAEGDSGKDKETRGGSADFLTNLLSEYLKGDEKARNTRKDPKNRSAEVVTEILSRYLADEEFKANRERIQQAAGERIRSIRDRYRNRARKRDPETAERERELSLRLAEVEAEAAELRLRLVDLLEEEGRLRADLEGL